MALTADSNLQNNETIYYQGKSAKIVSVDTNTVTIECNGRCFPVDRSKLATMPLFVYNQEQIERNNNLIAELKQKAEDYHQEKKDYKEATMAYLTEINNNCREWGVKLFSQMDEMQYKIQKGLKKDYWASRMDRVLAGIRETNAYNDICALTSENRRLMT